MYDSKTLPLSKDPKLESFEVIKLGSVYEHTIDVMKVMATKDLIVNLDMENTNRIKTSIETDALRLKIGNENYISQLTEKAKKEKYYVLIRR